MKCALGPGSAWDSLPQDGRAVRERLGRPKMAATPPLTPPKWPPLLPSLVAGRGFTFTRDATEEPTGQMGLTKMYSLFKGATQTGANILWQLRNMRCFHQITRFNSVWKRYKVYRNIIIFCTIYCFGLKISSAIIQCVMLTRLVSNLAKLAKH